MGSALETLCGQAYGAGKMRMLGIYMQRSWVILLTTALCLLPIYIFAPPILHLFGETTQISDDAGQYTFSDLTANSYSLSLYINHMLFPLFSEIANLFQTPHFDMWTMNI